MACPHSVQNLASVLIRQEVQRLDISSFFSGTGSRYFIYSVLQLKTAITKGRIHNRIFNRCPNSFAVFSVYGTSEEAVQGTLSLVSFLELSF